MPVQNFRHSSTGEYSEIIELKQEVDKVKNQKFKMAQYIEELKSEINSFKCGLRAMLGDQPEGKEFNPQLYEVDKSVKMGQYAASSESGLSDRNEDCDEFLKNRVIQL